MKSIIAFIRLLRPINLLLIALTMYAMRFGIIRVVKNLYGEGIEFQFSEFNFFLSVLVMMCLAGAGNIINDYFDLKVDRLNKPEKVLVGRTVKRRVAMVGHQVINASALLLSAYLAYLAGRWFIVVIPIFIATSLWFYSLIFKRQVAIGNFVVALLVGIVPIWAGIFEVPLLAKHIQSIGMDGNSFIKASWYWILGYAYFAFWLTLIREIVKDIEDAQGDAKAGFSTLPIVLSKSNLRWLLVGINGIFALSLIYCVTEISKLLKEPIIFISLSLLLILMPFLISSFLMMNTSSKKNIKTSSLLLKVSMLGAVIVAFCMQFWLIF